VTKSRPTALIADDEPLLREALARQLAQAWPELAIVAEARNGREAIERFEATHPDVCFLDVQMPGLNGVEAARRIGVSPSAAYRHFPNREGLLAVVGSQARQTLAARMLVAMDRVRARDPRRRAVLVMHELEGLPIEVIARTLGVTAVTVRWHLSKGRGQLAKAIRGQGKAGEGGKP